MQLTPGSSPAPVGAAAPRPSEESPDAIRLLAGYHGPPRTDSAGRVWNPDRYFFGGGSWQRQPGPIARTSDPFIFEHSRTGDFFYAIPLSPGSYELHLFFSIPSENVATFNVTINDESVMQEFDINTDAMGANIADERVFRDISPGQDGFLRIQFTGAMAPPSLNAIEILRSAPHTQLPIRLVTHSTPLTDSKGQFWSPDNYFMNGQFADQTRLLVDTPDPDLFAGERFGHFTYAIPVDSRGTYTVILHFAELYFGPGASGPEESAAGYSRLSATGKHSWTISISSGKLGVSVEFEDLPSSEAHGAREAESHLRTHPERCDRFRDRSLDESRGAHFPFPPVVSDHPVPFIGRRRNSKTSAEPGRS